LLRGRVEFGHHVAGLQGRTGLGKVGHQKVKVVVIPVRTLSLLAAAIVVISIPLNTRRHDGSVLFRRYRACNPNGGG